MKCGNGKLKIIVSSEYYKDEISQLITVFPTNSNVPFLVATLIILAKTSTTMSIVE